MDLFFADQKIINAQSYRECYKHHYLLFYSFCHVQTAIVVIPLDFEQKIQCVYEFHKFATYEYGNCLK